MNHYEAINDVLVNLFNEILDLEERALITGEYKNISVNDMHIIRKLITIIKISMRRWYWLYLKA